MGIKWCPAGDTGKAEFLDERPEEINGNSLFVRLTGNKFGILRNKYVFFCFGKYICASVGKADGSTADPFDILRIDKKPSAQLDKAFSEQSGHLGEVH